MLPSLLHGMLSCESCIRRISGQPGAWAHGTDAVREVCLADQRNLPKESASDSVGLAVKNTFLEAGAGDAWNMKRTFKVRAEACRSLAQTPTTSSQDVRTANPADHRARGSPFKARSNSLGVCKCG